MRTAITIPAIVAALLSPNPASAQTDDASSGLKLEITGFVAFQAGILAQDDKDVSDELDRDYGFGSNARLQFDLKAETASGLKYGGRIRMNNINARQNVTVDRQYVWLEGDFGRAQLGDQVPVGDIIRDAFVFYDGEGFCPWGNFGCNIDGRWNDLAGNEQFYSIGLYRSPSGLSTDTRIRYDTPGLAGTGVKLFTAFAPVVGGTEFKGPGRRSDLFDEGATYQNVVEGGIGYGKRGDDDVVARAIAAYGDGVDGNADLEAYAAGVMATFGALTASLDYTILVSAGGDINGAENLQTIALAVAYDILPDELQIGLGYSFTTGDTLPFSDGDAAATADLDADHIASATLLYTLAPGLALYGEVTYESQHFGGFEGNPEAFPGDVETTVLVSGTQLRF